MISAIQILKDVNASTKVLSLSSEADWLETNIKDLQVIKPEFDQPLHLRVHLYVDAEMQTLLVASPIDTHSASKVEYVEYLQNSNGQAKWVSPTTDGLPVSLSPVPAVVHVLDYMHDSNAVLTTKKLYVKYEWYSISSGEEHVSDSFSTVIPTATEAGANAANTVSKTQFEQLRQDVFPEPATAEEDQYGIVRCFSSKLNLLGEVQDGMELVLDSYSSSASYFIKLQTPADEDVTFRFYVDEGSGPVLKPSMNINTSFIFPKSSQYIVRVQFDNIAVSKCAYDGKSGSTVKFRTIEWRQS